jgi:hypothetical protein
MGAPTDRTADLNVGARVLLLDQVSEATRLLSSKQMPNQFTGNTPTSKISCEPGFELTAVREPASNLDAPHARSDLRSSTKVLLIGAILSVVDLTAITTIGQSTFAEIWQWLAPDRTFELTSPSSSPTPGTFAQRAELSSSRLVVEGARGAPGEPVPLGLMVRGDARGAIVHIKGLTASAHSSADRGWATDVAGTDTASCSS